MAEALVVCRCKLYLVIGLKACRAGTSRLEVFNVRCQSLKAFIRRFPGFSLVAGEDPLDHPLLVF